jgi:antitoxin VapB
MRGSHGNENVLRIFQGTRVRVGDELRIRPVRRRLTGVLKKFAKFSPDFMSEGREEHEQIEREGL